MRILIIIVLLKVCGGVKEYIRLVKVLLWLVVVHKRAYNYKDLGLW